MKITIKEFLNFMNEVNDSFEVDDSCDTNDYEIQNYLLKIYVDEDDNTYTNVDELPNKNVYVRSWNYKWPCFDDPYLEIWYEEEKRWY